MQIACVNGTELSAAQVYEIWRIRDAVFSVEQNCREADVDGIDVRADCFHLWVADDDSQLRSYARVYREDGTIRLGRVATRQADRGNGLSSAIMQYVLDKWGTEAIAIHAQAYLADWYTGFGFAVDGEPFVEAGINHLPMSRKP